MRSAYLSLGVDSDSEAERIFAALADGGEVFMPLQETFFATRFGQLRDRWGINWMILHERPMPPRG
jgi:PhnB protein